MLLRLGSHKPSSLGMTLSSLLDQLAKLPLPHTKEQEEDDVFMLCRCCTQLMNFVRPFAAEANKKSLRNGEQTESRASGDKDNELQMELLKL